MIVVIIIHHLLLDLLHLVLENVNGDIIMEWILIYKLAILYVLHLMEK